MIAWSARTETAEITSAAGRMKVDALTKRAARVTNRFRTATSLASRTRSEVRVMGSQPTTNPRTRERVGVIATSALIDGRRANKIPKNSAPEKNQEKPVTITGDCNERRITNTRTKMKSQIRGKKSRAKKSGGGATTLVPVESLSRWAVECLVATGFSSVDARQIASSLVQTSLWGIDSHGIARLGHYLSRITAGSIESRPKIRVRRTGPCTAQVDGGHGHGIVVCHRAMNEAIALARKNGIGAVGVGNSSHCGATALYGRQAARAGMIGISFTHSDAFVAPHGGTRKFLGTNPICITVPTRDRERPLCLDMATSAVPYNRIMNYRRENRPLQPGWALDKRGRMTTDPHAVTCLLPLAGHKGYALAFLIDLDRKSTRLNSSHIP